MPTRAAAVASLTLLVGCAGASVSRGPAAGAASARGSEEQRVLDSVDVALARTRERAQLFK